MRNLIAIIFTSIYIYSCCGTKPVDNSNIYNLYYHFQAEHIHFDSININKELKDVEEVINRLCSNLEINTIFKFKATNNILSDKKNVVLSSIDNHSSLENENAIHIHIPTTLDATELPFHSRGENYIKIPYLSKTNSVILLHEILHKIVNNIGHVSFDGNLSGCLLEKGNSCMNIMTETQISPFNFLITESQNRWINQRDNDRRCSNTHVYPKDLIEDGIEETFSCCIVINVKESEEFRSTMNEISASTEYRENLILVIEQLITNSLCPIKTNMQNLPEAVATIQNYQDTVSIEIVDLPIGTPVVVRNVLTEIELKHYIVAACKFYKFLYYKELEELVLKEAEYLTQGTSFDKETYARNRIIEIVYYMANEQEEMENSTELNFSILPH